VFGLLTVCLGIVAARPQSDVMHYKDAPSDPSVKGCKKKENIMKKGCACTLGNYRGCPNYTPPTTPATEAPTSAKNPSTAAPTTSKSTAPEPKMTTGKTSAVTSSIKLPTTQEYPHPEPEHETTAGYDDHHSGKDGDHPIVKPAGHTEWYDKKPHGGWKVEDILQVLGKLHEMRPDGDEDSNGNYFVGGDFVVNNGLINNQVGRQGHEDDRGLQFSSYLYCMARGMMDEEMAYQMHERFSNMDETLMAETHEVTMTLKAAAHIWECLGEAYTKETGRHMPPDSMYEAAKAKWMEHHEEGYEKP
jgi:hypothetical protein